jgi:hypothetical protein
MQKVGPMLVDRMKSGESRMVINGAGVDRMLSRRLNRLMPCTDHHHVGAYPLAEATAY